MAIGQALTSGYNTARRDTQRSFMPVINTLGQMIRANRAKSGGRTAVARGGWPSQSSASDERAAERQARRDQEKLLAIQESEAQMAQQETERQQMEKERLMEEENARRQEKHQADMERSAMEDEIKRKTAGMDEAAKKRVEAYERAKQGLMTKNAELIEEGMRGMMPTPEGKDADVITYGKTETGERKVTARPRKQEVPKFIFHPDGYVGVQFPGQEKPTVFENEEEAFKNVVAPMNPERWQTQGKGTGKDRVTQQKNIMEADYKERKLRADVHKDAHSAAMEQFNADGYFQPALYNEEEYQRVYNNYVQKATGVGPKPKGAKPGAGQAGKIYSGDKAPDGYPDAKRAPDGNWYIPRGDKWAPLYDQGGGQPKKAPPKKERAPGRSPLPTAEEMPEVEAAGVSFKGPVTSSAQGRSVMSDTPEFERKKKGKLYRGKAQPPDYPDAQWDEEERVWRYFDGEAERWVKVRI